MTIYAEEPDNGPMTIQVSNVAGVYRDIEIMRDAGVTVDALHEKIAQAFRISKDSFTLKFNGKEMHLGCTLDDLGIQPGSLITSLMVEQGGM